MRQVNDRLRPKTKADGLGTRSTISFESQGNKVITFKVRLPPKDKTINGHSGKNARFSNIYTK